MKDKAIAFALRVTGLGWIWKKFDGLKTKLGVAAVALGGAALTLSGLANILTEAHACEVMACVVGIARGFGDNPDFKTMMEGWLALSGALMGGGLAHKIVKAVDKDAGK